MGFVFGEDDDDDNFCVLFHSVFADTASSVFLFLLTTFRSFHGRLSEACHEPIKLLKIQKTYK